MVVEWLHGGRDFDHGIADGDDSVSAVSGRKNLALDDATVVANGNELHRVARDLAVQTIVDDESAHGYLRAGMFR